jgi:hypothetical protein
MERRPHPEFPRSYPDPEVVHLEQGQRAAVPYARWPTLFAVALPSGRYEHPTNRLLHDLVWAIGEAHDRGRH